MGAACRNRRGKSIPKDARIDKAKPPWRKDQLRQEKKEYHDCTDSEQRILNEYRSWAKSNQTDDMLAYKMSQLDFWRQRAQEEGIAHLL